MSKQTIDEKSIESIYEKLVDVFNADKSNEHADFRSAIAKVLAEDEELTLSIYTAILNAACHDEVIANEIIGFKEVLYRKYADSDKNENLNFPIIDIYHPSESNNPDEFAMLANKDKEQFLSALYLLMQRFPKETLTVLDKLIEEGKDFKNLQFKNEES